MENIERSSTGQRVTGHSFTVVLNHSDKDLVIHLAKDSEGLIHIGLSDLLDLVGVDESFIDQYISRMHIYDMIGTIQTTAFNKQHEMVMTTRRSLPLTFAIDFLDELAENPEITDEQAFKARGFLAQMTVYYFSTVYYEGLQIYEVA